MMEQVRRISQATEPDYTFLVVDAMTGQDAVTVAESFDATLALDGVILTKLDGDARGGAALSVKEVVGKPIAFASTGEKVEDFDLFHPDRLASRILGMGDVLTLIEKAEQVYEKDEAEAAAAKLLEGKFTLDDFLDQLQQVRKMGPLQNLIGMMPGMPKELRNAEIDEGQVNRVEAIIRSMTRDERVDPTIIDGSRRLRIANGSGTQTADVSQLIKQFREMQKMMKRMPGFSGTKALKGRKGKKGGGRKGGGGRVTPAGGRPRHARPSSPSRCPASTDHRRDKYPCRRPRFARHARAAHHRRSLRTRLRRSSPSARPSDTPTRKEDTSGRQAPPHADGQEEAADLPRGRGRLPVAPQRAVHRDRGHLRPPPRPVRHPHRQRQGRRLAAQGRPAHRVGAQAARDLGRLGDLQGKASTRPAPAPKPAAKAAEAPAPAAEPTAAAADAEADETAAEVADAPAAAESEEAAE